jgi:hypothetical protein
MTTQLRQGRRCHAEERQKQEKQADSLQHALAQPEEPTPAAYQGNGSADNAPGARDGTRYVEPAQLPFPLGKPQPAQGE